MGNEVDLLKRLSGKAADIMRGETRAQSAAICVREAPAGPEVLVITSRANGRWVIPKGTIKHDEHARDAAAREAHEEAGIGGKLSKRPVGYYTYLKGVDGTPCIVSVFLLEAKTISDQFPEADQRQHEWVSPIEASRRVDEPELKGLLVQLAA